MNSQKELIRENERKPSRYKLYGNWQQDRQGHQLSLHQVGDVYKVQTLVCSGEFSCKLYCCETDIKSRSCSFW